MQNTFSVLGGSVSSNTLGVGDSMLVTDTVNAQRVNANQFCIGTNCRNTFLTEICPAGTVAYRNNANGTVDCSSISCPIGTYFSGMTGPNQPICVALSTATCPTNTYISDYDAGTGTFSCTPIPPQVHVSNCPTGYLYAVVAGVAQCAPLAVSGGDCGPNRAVMGVNSNGTPICGDILVNAGNCPVGQIMTGMQANGSIICSSIATSSSCNSDGQVLGSISASRSANCASVSIAGGSCPSGIRAISSTGAVTCF